jgi:hypothetical protein
MGCFAALLGVFKLLMSKIALSSQVFSERQPRAELHFTTWSGRFGNGSELWRVHKAIGRSEIGVIERVEELCAELKVRLFSQIKLTV